MPLTWSMRRSVGPSCCGCVMRSRIWPTDQIRRKLVQGPPAIGGPQQGILVGEVRIARRRRAA
jgi:hypothetical protein